MPQYRKITLTLVCRADAAEQIEEELNAAVDLIHDGNILYEHGITSQPASRPEDADEYGADPDDDDYDSIDPHYDGD